jgi:pullulanase
MARKLIVDAVLYWAREYHIDGFRFDLMGLLPVSLMNEIQKRLDDAFGRGEKMVYGEPWSAGPTALSRPEPLAVKENFGKLDVAIAMFSDDTRDAIKGSVFNEHEPGFINGMCSSDEKMMRAIKAWRYSSGMPVKAPSQIITYVSAHDNQTLWDKLAVTTRDEELRLRQNHMAAAVYMTCQGIPFMLSGEEFARTKDGNSNSYNAPIRVNRLDWNRAFQYRGLVRYYQGLIALRKQIPGLCDKSEDAWRAIKTPWHEDGIVGFFVTSPARPGVRPCRWEAGLHPLQLHRRVLRGTAPPGGSGGCSWTERTPSSLRTRSRRF